MGVTQEIEEQYPECTNELLDFADRAYRLFCKKQHDYGDSNIRLGMDVSSSTSESKANNTLAQLGVVIRMNDKINRLLNLYKKDMMDSSAVDESIEDTLLDLHNYSGILNTLRKNKWGK